MPEPIAQEPVPANPPVSDVPASPPPPPAPPQNNHSPTLLAVASRYGIPPHVAATFTAEELRGEVQDRQLLARDQAIRQQVNPAAPTPAAAIPEPEFELPADLREQLAEMNPALLKALQAVGNAAVKKATEKLQGEIDGVRRQTQGMTFAQQVAERMNSIPGLGTNPPEGSAEAKKRAAIIGYLQAEEQRAGQPLGLDAIDSAAFDLYGFTRGNRTPAPTPPPGNPDRPVPTPVARPTQRTPQPETTESDIVAAWRKEIEEARQQAASGNGVYSNRP